MRNEFINEEWQIITSSRVGERRDAKKVYMEAYEIVTVRKDYWSIHHKKNGDLKSGAKKDYGKVCSFYAYVFFNRNIFEQLVTQHNAWIIRRDEGKMREFIKSEIQWHTQRVFKALLAHQPKEKEENPKKPKKWQKDALLRL